MTSNTFNPENREHKPHRNLYAWLWFLAGIIALILLLATGALYVKANSGPVSFAGTVAGPEGAVYLRSRPHPSAGVVTILEPGDLLEVQGSRDVDGTYWYEVHAEGNRGWLPDERVEKRD